MQSEHFTRIVPTLAEFREESRGMMLMEEVEL